MVGTSRIALLVTVIPIILLAKAIAVLGLGNPDFSETVIVGEFDLIDILLYVGIGLVVAAIISSFLLANKGKREIAKGIRFGVVIDVVVLVIVFVVASALSPQ